MPRRLQRTRRVPVPQAPVARRAGRRKQLRGRLGFRETHGMPLRYRLLRSGLLHQCVCMMCAHCDAAPNAYVRPCHALVLRRSQRSAPPARTLPTAVLAVRPVLPMATSSEPAAGGAHATGREACARAIRASSAKRASTRAYCCETRDSALSAQVFILHVFLHDAATWCGVGCAKQYDTFERVIGRNWTTQSPALELSARAAALHASGALPRRTLKFPATIRTLAMESQWETVTWDKRGRRQPGESKAAVVNQAMRAGSLESERARTFSLDPARARSRRRAPPVGRCSCPLVTSVLAGTNKSAHFNAGGKSMRKIDDETEDFHRAHSRQPASRVRRAHAALCAQTSAWTARWPFPSSRRELQRA